jgi:hypothetical protein
MGAEPYRYVVDYQEDVQRALDALRLDVFRKGEYEGAGNGAENPDEVPIDAARQAIETETGARARPRRHVGRFRQRSVRIGGAI